MSVSTVPSAKALSAKASSLLTQISILENGLRRGRLDLDIIVEAGEEYTSPHKCGDQLAAMHMAAVEKLRVDLQARRAKVAALEDQVAAANAATDAAIAVVLPKLSAWLRGHVEGACHILALPSHTLSTR